MRCCFSLGLLMIVAAGIVVAIWAKNDFVQLIWLENP